MKTIFSYQTDIIRLSENRTYHAVVIISKQTDYLEAKVILESDFSKDEIVLGTYHSTTFDYAECYSHIYSMLNDLSSIKVFPLAILVLDEFFKIIFSNSDIFIIITTKS